MVVIFTKYIILQYVYINTLSMFHSRNAFQTFWILKVSGVWDSHKNVITTTNIENLTK